MPVTQRGLASLGEAVASLCQPNLVGPLLFGDQINRALKAALKATVIGGQSDEQIDEELAKARKAFTRQVNRMVAAKG